MYSKASLLLLTLSACTVRATTDCFTQIGVDYTKPADDVHRISKGISLGNNTDQSLTGGGYVSESATLNITSDSALKIFQAVRQKVDKPFNGTLTGGTSSTIMHLHSNQSGYIGFTTNMRCFAGTLGDCIGGDVEEGTAIEACTPTILNEIYYAEEDDSFIALDGTISFVSTSPSEVANMTTNPAAVRPENATRIPNGKLDHKKGNGAGQMSLGIGAIAVVAGTVFGLL